MSALEDPSILSGIAVPYIVMAVVDSGDAPQGEPPVLEGTKEARLVSAFATKPTFPSDSE